MLAERLLHDWLSLRAAHHQELERLDGKVEWSSGVKQLEERKRAREAAEKKLS